MSADAAELLRRQCLGARRREATGRWPPRRAPSRSQVTSPPVAAAYPRFAAEVFMNNPGLGEELW